MDCIRGFLPTLSVLVVRIALLEYSKIHEKAYKFIVCEFGMYYAMHVSAPSLHNRVYRLSDNIAHTHLATTIIHVPYQLTNQIETKQ